MRLGCIVFTLCFQFAVTAVDVRAWERVSQPNVVVILTDDQGWGDLSLHGNSNINTPNLDGLARAGARFDRFYVCPVCAPTRAEFLTGRYHLRGGVRGVTAGAERLDTDERTIAQCFKAAGYRTAAFGKWHNGMQYPYHPLARGFDEFYGYCSGHWGDYFSPQLEHNGRLVTGNGYLVDDFTDHALNFMEQNASRPFFLYLPMPTPHAPMQVPDEYWARYAERPLVHKARAGLQEDENFTRAALAMVECIDANVGRILRKLEELRLAENTVVVFFCDNGPNSYRWNGDMKGRKASTDEGGVRSPLFVRWPDRIDAGRLITQISCVIDLMPTLAELAGVPLVAGKPLDGVSLVPLLSGRSSSLRDRKIFSHWNKKVSVRTQHFRLDHQGALFDMVSDSGQRADVTSKFPDVANELRDSVAAWKSDVLADLPERDSRPFPIGHPDFFLTQLPARDGTGHGNVQRSAKAPNCSYFKNWTSTNDKITWPVEVLSSGRFEVDMYYACPDDSVGAEIELSFGDHSIKAEIEHANDPPEVGAEHDRVPRTTQSLMKNFKPLRLGTISMEEGVGELKLRLTRLANSTDVNMRLLMFRRVP